MSENPLIENDSVVHALQHALQSGAVGLNLVPKLVCRVIKEQRWQERVVERTQQRARFQAFAAFVTSTPPDGLGSDLATLKRLCGDTPEALDAIDQVLMAGRGNPGSIGNIVPNRPGRPAGNTREKALRRLRKDRKDLHARVLAGELSPHAAMIEAGFRHRPTPVEELRRAWKKASAEEREAFLRWSNENP